ncbi:MAG: 6-pyruvoyl-tetrahydropterin synthase-related protein [Acidobacteria bacterium]|nr:6-pyruvoyl-tetrahydropterin synthase-related protein [Acidobacteriota bacterium]
MKKPLLVFAILLATVLILGWPLLTHDALPSGSDVVFAYHSAHGFSQALFEGVLYPRWVENSNNNFGGPTFIYYCPLPFYAVSLVSLITPDLVAAFRLALLLVALLSGWTLYLAARPITTRAGATLAAALYVLLPYHVLDLYDRFAFAEYCAFIWFPLIILGLRRIIAEGRREAWPALAAALTGLLFTHLVTAYMGILVLGPYALYLGWRRRDWRGLATVTLAASLALMAAAIYLIPMIHQRPEVHLDWVVDAPYGDWRRNFVYRDEVAFGFKRAPIKPWVNRVTTTQGILALAAGVLFVSGRRRRRDVTPGAGTLDGEAMLTLAFWTVFLQIPASAFLWRLIPELGTVQFPWRFGLFQGLTAVMLVAVACSVAGKPDSAPETEPDAGPRWRRPPWLAAVVLFLASIPALAVSLQLIQHPARPVNFDTTLAARQVYLSRVMDEYLPRKMKGWRAFVDKPVTGMPRAQLEGPGQVRITSWQTHRRRLTVTAQAPVRLVLRTFHHPGWAAWVDGEPAPVLADNPLHLITVAVPAGSHEVEVRFTATPDRVLGRALSFLGVATIAAFAIRQRFTRPSPQRRPDENPL